MTAPTDAFSNHSVSHVRGSPSGICSFPQKTSDTRNCYWMTLSMRKHRVNAQDD